MATPNFKLISRNEKPLARNSRARFFTKKEYGDIQSPYLTASSGQGHPLALLSLLVLRMLALHFAILRQDQTLLDLLFILKGMVVHVLAVFGRALQFDEIIL